ncbi:hypothetical protein AURDEDRAFT_177628 [Auricularia subglabra TFB-10046 SS5]|uniref:Uncharacterized protein n=1 Tax=Auricularia subglabra (strain TFB-10046 / SS5) TaxID=717982 RepID=J0D3N4_AURST|nr:hypothetical protein AURDEDRAFT_177628 [Auricularia subglabra TFB-10046 SS5]
MFDDIPVQLRELILAVGLSAFGRPPDVGTLSRCLGHPFSAWEAKTFIPTPSGRAQDGSPPADTLHNTSRRKSHFVQVP